MGNSRSKGYLVSDYCNFGPCFIDKNTPLMRAILNNDFSEVAKAVNKNNINKIYTITIKHNGHILKETVLHTAIKVASFEIVKLLVDAGANIHKKNGSNETPLYIASRRDKYKVMDLLVENEADLTMTIGNLNLNFNKNNNKFE